MSIAWWDDGNSLTLASPPKRKQTNKKQTKWILRYQLVINLCHLFEEKNVDPPFTTVWPAITAWKIHMEPENHFEKEFIFQTFILNSTPWTPPPRQQRHSQGWHRPSAMSTSTAGMTTCWPSWSSGMCSKYHIIYITSIHIVHTYIFVESSFI